MAEEEDENENEDEVKAKPKGSAIAKISLFIILPLFIIGGIVGGLYFAGIFDDGSEAVEDVAEGSEEEGGEGESEGEDEEEDAEPSQALYVPINPAFVVNFVDGGKARFLQITMELMTRDPEIPAHVETHLPAIRNNLVMLFSSQTYDNISTLEGKESLREEALTVVQEILEEETGNAGVETVYFTSLVMQ
jgi:flagellar FliL protein